jgi:molybdopterin/thiamine biosynthesis adenylyltransferase/rhodanese-related sulfurtransferase
MLSQSELERYSRHIILPEIGIEGQEKLRNAKVLIAGVGGLGCPVSLYLAAAGVGTLGLVDYDNVSISNLHRQVLFNSDDVGKPKVTAAELHLKSLNPDVEIRTYNIRLTAENAMTILKDYDIIADGSDNFETKYLINDACVLLGKPNVYGSILRFEGQVAVYVPNLSTQAKDLWLRNRGPCYRCIFPEPPSADEVPSCEEAGVLGILPGIIGTIQANEIVKLILGLCSTPPEPPSRGESLAGRLVIFDALKMKFKEINFERNPECAVCGENPTIKELSTELYEAICQREGEEHRRRFQTKFWNEKTQTTMTTEITVQELKQKLDSKEKFVLLDVREPLEKQIADIGGILVPLNTLPHRLDEFSKEDEIIVYCRTGNRSYYAADFLRKQGFSKAKNLAGGIHAWSDKIDSSVVKY